MALHYPHTHDQRRINNSNARTLLQNWVEERSVEKYDKLPDEFLNSNNPPIKHFKYGHKGLITIDESNDSNKKYSTYKNDFVLTNTYDANGEPKGIRCKLEEQSIRNRLLQEMEQEERNLDGNDYFDEPTNYVTEAKDKYIVPGFVHQPPKPTTRHDVYSEMPVSYWTEKRHRVHGVSQSKSLDTPFRKNAAFSTPIQHSYENAPPGEMENYPYMSQKAHNSAVIN